MNDKTIEELEADFARLKADYAITTERAKAAREAAQEAQRLADVAIQADTEARRLATNVLADIKFHRWKVDNHAFASGNDVWWTIREVAGAYACVVRAYPRRDSVATEPSVYDGQWLKITTGCVKGARGPDRDFCWIDPTILAKAVAEFQARTATP